MKNNDVRRLALLPLGVMVLTASQLLAGASPISASPPVVQAEMQGTSAKATVLLKEVRWLAGMLERDADTLQSYRNHRISWQSHAFKLNSIKEHINGIGSRLATLEEIRPAAAPWQQAAIAGIAPVAAGLAASTQSAIEHLNENKSHLFAPAYTEHLEAIYDTAAEMKGAVHLYLDLANTQDRLDWLQNQLSGSES